MELLAPAKINLSLDILGRRPDGYHNLRMVMQSISLYDRVSLESAEKTGVEVCCSEDSVPCDEKNTVVRAAYAFFCATGIQSEGLLFRIEKKIPQQAGLGGGSADAAAALKLLNEKYCTDLSLQDLQQIGLQAGADIPFCLQGGTALTEGIGEKVKPLPEMPPCQIVVCRPSVGISTKEAYEAFDHSGGHASQYSAKVLTGLNSGNLKQVAASLGNVFELTSVPEEIHKIEQIMMKSGAAGACMTGSGSAVFGLFCEIESAETCRSILSNNYPFVFLCHPVFGGQQK